jgi:hypothetical protein
MHEEIKSRLNSGSALSSYLLPKSIKIKIHGNTNLPHVSPECKTWSLKLWAEHRLRVFGNRVLGKMFGH